MGEIVFEDETDSATCSSCCDETSSRTASMLSSSSSRMGPPPPYTPTPLKADSDINAFVARLPAGYPTANTEPPPPYSPAPQPPKSSGKSASHKASKDLIGNCKAFRIEHNKSDLRIIGNCNRIRIINNTGNLHIIGNCTRVKINSNAGHLKYIGNDGRICLGSDSTQQSVDYIGNNGLLKVVNSLELNCEKSETKPKTASTNCTSNLASSTASIAPSGLVKSKSASFGGDCKNAQWQQLNELLQHKKTWQNFGNLSMPNLKEHFTGKSEKNKTKNSKCNCNCKCSQNLNNHKSNSASNRPAGSPTVIINNIGNITIRNSANVTI